MKTTSLPPNVQRLLVRLVEALETAGVDYAIGGAVAMAAHGYRRFTSDVDVFSTDAAKVALLRALKLAGIPATPVMAPFHYVIWAEGSTGEERVDLLFSVTEPDLSAVEFPDRLVVTQNLTASVYPVSLLVVAKFYADRPKDHADIAEMLDRGMFEPEAIEQIIASIDAPEAPRFRSLIAWLTRPSSPPPRPSRRIPRK